MGTYDDRDGISEKLKDAVLSGTWEPWHPAMV